MKQSTTHQKGTDTNESYSLSMEAAEKNASVEVLKFVPDLTICLH